MLKKGLETQRDTCKLQGVGNSHFCLCLCDQKSLSARQRERERGESGAVEVKVITPKKIVPHKCRLPSSNISVKKVFDTDFRNCMKPLIV